jgi:outer membrane lipoprotein LolB
MIHKFPLFIIVIAVLLSGCAARGPVADGAALDAWQQRKTSLLALVDWGFDGRAVINDGRSSVNMALHWQQEQEQFDIRLMSVFGQQKVRLQGLSDGPVILSRAGQSPREAADVMTLMQQELGWALPLDGLRFWVTGIPVPARAADWAVDSQGRLEWLEQDGWRVEFSSYQTVAGQSMPRKIRLSHASLRARLVLDRWQTHRPALEGL